MFNNFKIGDKVKVINFDCCGASTKYNNYSIIEIYQDGDASRWGDGDIEIRSKKHNIDQTACVKCIEKITTKAKRN